MSVVAYNIRLTGRSIVGSGFVASNPSGSWIVTYSTGSGVFFPVLSGSPVTFPTLAVNYLGPLNWAVTVPSQSYSNIIFRVTAVNSYITASTSIYDICVGFSRDATVTSSICCAPTLTSVEASGSLTSSVNVFFATSSASGCLACTGMTVQSSSDGSTWSVGTSGSCTSPIVANAPATGSTFYYRLQQTCSGSVTSSFSNTGSFFNPVVFTCSQCNNWEYNNVPVGGDIIRYFSCSTGASSSLAVGEGETGSFCNCDDLGNPTADNGTQLTQIGSC